MEMESNIISKDKYRQCISSWKKIEEIVESFKGKTLMDGNKIIGDCARYYISELLERDWYKIDVYIYNEKELDFINSKYLSDYFKDNIRELLDGTMTNEIQTILNSDKHINQMSDEDIKKLYNVIDEYYNVNKYITKQNISSHFLTYLYKLNGEGISLFIKNNISGYEIARQILLTSGLNDRASYYSGRGVIYEDLNVSKLVEIFKKLLKIDANYAIEFADMVCQMRTLGATEFVNSFMSFANNEFKLENIEDENKNVSLDRVYDERRNAIAYMSMYSTVRRRNDGYGQVRLSEEMKNSFISIIGPTLKEINPKFDKKDKEDAFSYGQSWNTYTFRNKR